MISQQVQFITPNAAEGLKVSGTGDFPIPLTDKYEKGKYVILTFASDNELQQVMLVWRASDQYADQIMDRVINSVELNKVE